MASSVMWDILSYPSNALPLSTRTCGAANEAIASAGMSGELTRKPDPAASVGQRQKVDGLHTVVFARASLAVAAIRLSPLWTLMDGSGRR